MGGYVVSVGMEVHAELATRSKMFCRCRAEFGGEPNSRVCPVCLGMPGALPVPNREAIRLAMRAALALHCTVPESSVFHRKSYFYPDLPKGYQTTQYGETNPVGYAGWLDIPRPGGPKRIKIRRVHLEEDTGKLLHLPELGGSGVDYNRAGVPLLEIVTEFPPDISSPEEARLYATNLRALLVWLGVCDGRMEQGSLRCEPNVSIRPEGAAELGTKTELKNLNSLKSVELGVAHEAARQAALLDSGGRVAQETRGWDEDKQASFPMRSKEDEEDYRYFPCPDLAPLRFDRAWVEAERAALPELPWEREARYVGSLGLSPKDAARMVAQREWSDWFEACLALGGDPQPVANWMQGELARRLNDSGQELENCKVTPENLVELIRLTAAGTVSGKNAKAVLAEMFETGEAPGSIAGRLGLAQISDPVEIESAVAAVLAREVEAVASFQAGKEAALGYLVGKVLQDTGGRANAPMVQEAIRRALKPGSP